MQKKVIIFGAGCEGKQALELLGRERVHYFADNDMTLWGKKLGNIEIISCESLKKISKEYYIVIATRRYYAQIAKQLKSMNITDFEEVYLFLIREKFALSKNVGHRVVLMNTHDKTNVGDHLISVAEKKFFEMYLPNYDVVEIPADYIDNSYADLKRFISEEDIIAITGGGFLGSLWLEAGELNVRKIVQTFVNNKIIIMPQTLYFEDTQEGIKQREITKAIYSKHPNLIICLREKISYNLAKKLFGNSLDVCCYPDMVTILNFGVKLESSENKIGLCLRSDKESILTLGEKEILRKYAERNRYEIIEFSMHTAKSMTEKQREQAIIEKYEIVRNLKLVVTDRLHCMLLCAICGVPCIAFDNLSKKVSGVYEWIKNNIYIKFANNTEECLEYIKELWNQTDCAYHNELLEPYFADLAKKFQV